MNKLNCQFLEEAVYKFGSRFGDGSLRYCGITWFDDFVKERVYRSPLNKEKGNLPSDVKNLWDMYFEELSQRLDVKICDYSYSVFNGEESIRLEVIFRTSPNKIYEDYIHEMKGIPSEWKSAVQQNILNFIKAFSPSDSPLRILGIELNKKYELLNLKYYLYFDKRASITLFSDCQFKFLECISGENVCDLFGKTKEIMSVMTKCNYTPIFIGVNHSNDLQESKLYFISKLNKHQIPVYSEVQMENTISSLGLEKYFPEDYLKYFSKLSLYLEGVAYSLSTHEVNRLYFKEISNRHMK